MELDNKYWPISDGNYPQRFQTEKTVLPRKSLHTSLEEEFPHWHPSNPVFIDAPTGSGKSTFIYKTVLPYAIKNHKTVLMVSNRIALNKQQRQDTIQNLEVFFQDKTPLSDELMPEDDDCAILYDTVAVVTYQGLRSFLTPSELPEKTWNFIRNLGYAIFDECHYFYSDALFNPFCGKTLRSLPQLFPNAVRVYMTATPWEIFDKIVASEYGARFDRVSPLQQIQDCLAKTARPFITAPRESLFYKNPEARITFTLMHYQMEADYSNYTLHFFGDEIEFPPLSFNHKAKAKTKRKDIHALFACMNPLPCQENKWLIFVDSRKNGQLIRSILTDMNISTAYIDAATKEPKGVWDEIIKQNDFRTDVLISTPVIDNGVNIISKNIKNIVVFATDRTSFIQEIGRKRIATEEQVHIWVCVPTRNKLERIMRKMKDHINWAEKLINHQLYHNLAEYVYAVKSLWANRTEIQYPSLFYVDDYGRFQTDEYALEVLKIHYNFLSSLMYGENYQKIVQSWLPNVNLANTLPTDTPSDNPLVAVFEKNLKSSLTEEEFQEIRQAVVQVVKDSDIEKIRSDRENHLSAGTLNRFLEMLEIPFRVSKKKKQWTIDRCQK